MKPDSVFHAVSAPAPTLPTPWVLQAEGLCFAWPQCALFQQLHLQLPAGATLLLGGEGSGKTTLLRLLAGSAALQQGGITLHGVALASAPQAYCRQVFWQDPRAAHDLPVSSAQAWWRHMAAQHPGWDAGALDAHVQGLGLQLHQAKPLAQLSAGSRRKVLLAAALASGAALTLIDEPLAALDATSVRYLCQALATTAQQACQSGRALVVAHHADLPGVPWAQTLVLPDPGAQG